VQTPARRGEVWYVAVTDYPRGMGSTARARSICQALSLAGYDVRLLIPYALGHGDNTVLSGTADGTPFEYLRRSTRRPSTPLGVVLAKTSGNVKTFVRLLTTRRRPACIFVYNATLLDCWGSLLAGRWFGIPVVLDLSDDWHDPAAPIQALGRARYLFQRFALSSEAVLYRRMAAVLVVSRRLHDRVAPQARTTLLCPAAFDPAPFAQAVPERLAGPDEFEILYAGSISRTEGVPLLVEAVGLLASAGLRPRLFVVGNPAQNETIQAYRELAARVLPTGGVNFLPGVERSRYASLLRGADLLVIPRPTSAASAAGFPYKLIEFLASGTPLVVTRFGDVEHYFADGVHCRMCAPDDARALAEAIRAVVERPDEARAAAAVGQRHVGQLFSRPVVAGQLASLLASLAGPLEKER
jgi:glycosyltransferase involved in cell wall biosynthesis